MTPLHIEILIHANTRADTVQLPNWAAPAQFDFADELENLGLVKLKRNSFDNWTGYMSHTEKGRAFLYLLCNTELPEPAFIDDTGNVINYR